MKKSFINKYLMIGACIFLQACARDAWFNSKQNQSQVVPSTVDNFQAILDNSEMNGNGPYLGETASDEHYVTDANFGKLQTNEMNAYTWSHAYPYTAVPDWLSSYGDGSYSKIYDANLILDGLQNISPSSSDNYNNVKGEALFYRAKNFYDLAQEYAPVYDSATASSDLGIPLKLTADITQATTRATVKQTYDQIISDLTQASALLPNTPANVERPSKPAAYGLFARLYLSVGNYKDAGLYADSALAIYHTLLDYNTLDSTATYPIPLYNAQVIFNYFCNSGSGVNTSNALVDTSFFNLFAPNDLRRIMSFTVNSDGTVIYKCGNYYNTPFSGISTEELYLIRAECYARAGNASAAMDDINTLLHYRYKTGTYTDQTAASADDALKIVLTERRKELYMTGLRWSDLRRLNKDPRFQVTLTRTVNGQTYTLKPNSYQYTFPIPDDIINISGIQQNPGW